jgi:hypothetical protein
MWRIFGCLTRAVLVLDKASEDLDTERPELYLFYCAFRFQTSKW